MDHMNILKRSWAILWSYKALWIFGIIIALLTISPSGGGGGGGGGGGSGTPSAGSYNFPNNGELQGALQGINHFFQTATSEQAIRVVYPIIIALVCLALLVFVALRVAYYVSDVALIRMVDGYENTGEKLRFRQGWRLGWSRAAWRLFWIDLVIFVPLVVIFVALFSCAALPVLLGTIGQREPGLPAVVASVGMAFLFIFLAIVVGLLVSFVLEVIRRVAALENRGVFDSIRRGWWLVRHNFSSVGLMWLILLGIRIGFTILMIPVFFLLLAVAGLIGGGIGVGLYFLVHLTGNTLASWITAGIVGGGLFLLLIGAPLIFLGGLRETYFSTVWTLTYRELPVKEALE